jgi:hypothetical protein
VCLRFFEEILVLTQNLMIQENPQDVFLLQKAIFQPRTGMSSTFYRNEEPCARIRLSVDVNTGSGISHSLIAVKRKPTKVK